MIDAKTFHPLRGHVALGEKVLFKNGEVLELVADGFNWGMKDKDGKILYTTGGAYDLTAWIVERDSFYES